MTALPIVAGVDVGLTGAVALLTPGGAAIIDIPTRLIREDSGAVVKSRIDTHDLARQVREVCNACPGAPRGHAFIEHQQPFMDNDAKRRTAIAALLRAYGTLEAAFELMGFEVIAVPPQTWQKLYGIVGKGDNDRVPGEMPASVLHAARLYPSLRHMLSRVKDHNRADALLIARWGQRAGEGSG